MLQVATADELGGRSNPKTGRDGKVELIDKDKIRTAADKEYEGNLIGGYAAIKAYVRAKWETARNSCSTGEQAFPSCRFIAASFSTIEKYGQAEREKMLELLDLAREQMIEGGYSKVPNLNVRCAMDCCTRPRDQRGGGQQLAERFHAAVCSRALMPRTAAVPVPSLRHINVKSEQEVDGRGHPRGRRWDAWLKAKPRHSTRVADGGVMTAKSKPIEVTIFSTWKCRRICRTGSKPGP